MILSEFWSRYGLQNFRKRIFLGDDQGELKQRHSTLEYTWWLPALARGGAPCMLRRCQCHACSRRSIHMYITYIR
jgi:hypothetical protein